MRTRSVMSAASVAALSIAVLAACGGGSGDGSGSGGRYDDTTSDADDDTGSPSGPYVGTGAKTAVTAMDTAVGEVDGGAVLDIDLDDDGGQQWEVTVASGTDTEYELRVSADGSKVEANNEDKDLDDDLAALADAGLSAQDAAERAAKDHSGDVTGVDFETDDGNDNAPIWQVTLDDGGTVTEYRLDADSGETLGSEAED